MSNIYSIVTAAIVDWMKRNAQKYPDRYEILKDIIMPEGEKLNFTVCKKAAFKRLEKAGFILEYQGDSNAKVVDYKTPEDIGKKIARKLIPDEDLQEDDIEVPRDTGTPDKCKEKDKPKGIFVFNETIPNKACIGLAKIIEAIADFPADRLTVKIQISKAE